MTARETIYAALFTKISSLGSFNTKSRRLKHWNDVPIPNQPAIFMVQKGETIKQPGRGIPGVITGRVEFYIYVSTPEDSDTVPATIINPIVDAIQAALAPDVSTGVQTLGGLVSHCWMEGDIETDEGYLGAQGVVIIPINFLTPE